MKILMLNFEFPPIGGGAANANYYLLREFSRFSSLEIDLITSSAENMAEKVCFSQNITIYKLDVRKRYRFYWRTSEILRWTYKAYFLAIKLRRRNKYDLCHCWFGWPAGVIGYLTKDKIPYLVALRGSDVPGYNERIELLDKFLFSKASEIIWKNAAAVTSLSRKLANLAQKTCSSIDFNIVYNGIDIEKFSPGKKNSASCNILFVGRLIPRKGVFYLLQAFNELITTGKQCKLTIAGDGPEIKILESYCHENKLQRLVTFLGEVGKQDIPKVYRKADVFVLPSIGEALGNVTLEAMASGLPVVTTDTGAAELIDDNGIIVKPKNYRMIMDALNKYLSDSELLTSHGRKSRELAEKMHWTKMADEYFILYKKIIRDN